jgi:hypothetical protein
MMEIDFESAAPSRVDTLGVMRLQETTPPVKNETARFFCPRMVRPLNLFSTASRSTRAKLMKGSNFLKRIAALKVL